MAISFDGIAKQITITELSTVKIIDIYSAWKDWTQLSDNAKYLQAFRTFGGDPTASGQFAPKYFFLLNGWQIVCNGLDILFDGNLYAEQTASPYININSNITLKTSDATTVSTGGSALTTDEHNKLFDNLTEDDFLALK